MGKNFGPIKTRMELVRVRWHNEATGKTEQANPSGKSFNKAIESLDTPITSLQLHVTKPGRAPFVPEPVTSVVSPIAETSSIDASFEGRSTQDKALPQNLEGAAVDEAGGCCVIS